MDKEIKVKNFESIFIKMEENDDPRNSRAEVWVCHDGWNLNGSYMSKDTIEDAANKSIVSTPLVGFKKVTGEKEDFAGHEEKIVINEDGEVEEIYLGSAFGYVPESAEWRFEEKTVEGVTRNYLVTEAVIWNAFEEAKIITRDGVKGQSMELHPEQLEYNFVEDFEGQSGFVITSMIFDKFCALGDDVTPAMTGALIETFTKKFSVDGFKQKVREYEESLEGGEEVSKKKVDDTLDNKIDKDNVDNVDDNKTVDEPETNNELTKQQVEDVLNNALRAQDVIDWGYVVDFTEEMVFFVDFDNENLYAIMYTMTDDGMVEFDMETMQDAMFRPVTKEQNDMFEFDVFESIVKVKVDKAIGQEKENYTKEKSELEGELKQLKDTNKSYSAKLDEYEKEEKLSLVSSVENLTEDEKLEFKENLDTYSFDSLEKAILETIGRKEAKFSTRVKPKLSKFYSEPVDEPEEDEDVDPELEIWNNIKEK